MKNNYEQLHHYEPKDSLLREKIQLLHNIKKENSNNYQSLDQSSFQSEKCNDREIQCIHIFKKISKAHKLASYSYKKRNGQRSIEVIQSVGRNSSFTEVQLKQTKQNLMNIDKIKKQTEINNDNRIESYVLITNKSKFSTQGYIQSSCITKERQIQQPNPFQPNQPKLSKNYNKELHLPLISYENLKKQMKQLYQEEDDKILISLIEKELKVYQKASSTDSNFNQSVQLQVNNKIGLGQQIDRQQVLFLKCAFLTLSCNIHQQFTQYSQGVLKQNSDHHTNSNNSNNITQISSSNSKLNTINKLNHSQEGDEEKIHIESSEPLQKIPNKIYQNIQQEERVTNLPYSQTGTIDQRNTSENKCFFNLSPNSKEFLQNFDFSNVRQNQVKSLTKMREKKPNSSYTKNSQFHNLNKLFMYNILSMFRIDSLDNLNIPQQIITELTKFIQKFKLSSRRDFQNPYRGYFDYFSHSHYKVLFLIVNSQNLQHMRDSVYDMELHKKCFGIDLSHDVSEIDFTYINLIKEICFNIFIANIRENELFDDGSSSKQNVRRKYTQKVINGIKKLAHGVPTKRF